MFCEYFSNILGPCFALFNRVNMDQGATNNTELLTCKQRCTDLKRTVPSFSLVQRADLVMVYSSCKQSSLHTDCLFPLDVNYNYVSEEWIDGSTNEKVNLPWKRRKNLIETFPGVIENYPGKY